MLVALYRRQIVKCHTLNQFNRLHIALAHRMTPLELKQISKVITKSYPLPPATEWASLLRMQARRSGKAEPEPFVRKRLRPHLYLYSSGGPTREKTLAICFPGNSRRLMMALPTFLQHIDASRFDVLLVMRHGTAHYSNGVPGLAGSFAELMQVLRDVTKESAYKNVVSFGTSSGGVAAVLASIHLSLDKGISVSGSSVRSDGWKHVLKQARLRRRSEGWKGKPQLMVVFGADHDVDRLRAGEMYGILRAELYPLPGQKSHGAILGSLRRRKLKNLLESLLTVQSEEPSPDSA